MQTRELGLPFWKAVSNSQPGLLGRQTYPEGGEGHFLFSSLSPFSVSLLHSRTFPDAHQQDPKWVLEPWAVGPPGNHPALPGQRHSHNGVPSAAECQRPGLMRDVC